MTGPRIEIIRESAPKGEVIYVGFFITENDRRVVLGSHLFRGALYGPTAISKTRMISRQVLIGSVESPPEESEETPAAPPIIPETPKPRGRKRRSK